ncbi:MAG: NAD(P)-binding domain-containing protein, partial [Myxococcales bacterium]|nr:NAD(P)-binding domain-containing protein [Myxococcales bacterium]
RYGTPVTRIDRPGEVFEVHTLGGVRQAPVVVVATGLGVPWRPDIPGIEHAEGYDEVSVDPRDFVDQRVLVIGKGNSAFELANGLVSTARVIHLCSPNPVRLAWQTHYVGHLRAVNNDILDSYQLKSQNAVLDAVIERIEPVPRPGRPRPEYRVSLAYRHAHGEREQLVYDRIIACTGWRFDDSIFADACRPDATINPSSAGQGEGKLPAITPSFESTRVPGLFFAGSLTAARGYGHNTSAFIHGARYNALALHRVLRRRLHGEPWPSQALEARPAALAEATLARVNRSSAMWQQFGYIGDVICLHGASPRLLPDVPLDLVEAGLDDVPGPYCTVTLEYGARPAPDPFAIERVHREDVARAHESQFLHPIVRHFDAGGRRLAEHHVIEDLAAEWREPVHLQPLVRFFERVVAGGALRGSAGDA